MLRLNNVFRWAELGNADLAIARFVILGRSLTSLNTGFFISVKWEEQYLLPAGQIGQIKGGSVCAQQVTGIWSSISKQLE